MSLSDGFGAFTGYTNNFETFVFKTCYTTLSNAGGLRGMAGVSFPGNQAARNVL